MRDGSKSHGYTIVEVMLFLAISGSMFLMAAVMINGKQANAEFKQGMNSMDSQLSRVIDDVSNGRFPSINGFHCYANSGGQPQFDNNGVVQGANQGCTFIGKIVQFDPGSANGDNYDVLTVAGRQYKGTALEGLAPTSFGDAAPRVVPNFTDHEHVEWSFKVTKMFSGTPSNHIQGVGFFSSLASYSGGILATGAQNVTVVALTGAVDSSSNLTTLTPIVNPNIVLCLAGSGDKVGTLTIGGGNGQRLTTTIKMNDAQGVCG